MLGIVSWTQVRSCAFDPPALWLLTGWNPLTHHPPAIAMHCCINININSQSNIPINNSQAFSHVLVVKVDLCSESRSTAGRQARLDPPAVGQAGYFLLTRLTFGAHPPSQPPNIFRVTGAESSGRNKARWREQSWDCVLCFCPSLSSYQKLKGKEEPGPSGVPMISSTQSWTMKTNPRLRLSVAMDWSTQRPAPTMHRQGVTASTSMKAWLKQKEGGVPSTLTSLTIWGISEPVPTLSHRWISVLKKTLMTRLFCHSVDFHNSGLDRHVLCLASTAWQHCWKESIYSVAVKSFALRYPRIWSCKSLND